MKSKDSLEARATIFTDDGCNYDIGVAFLYEDEEEFNAGAKVLYKEIFKEDVYIADDGMGLNVIPVNRIVTIRVDRDIPTV